MKRIILLIVFCLSFWCVPVIAAPPRPQPPTNSRNNERQNVFWTCANSYASRTKRNINQVKGDEAKRVIKQCRAAAVRYGGK